MQATKRPEIHLHWQKPGFEDHKNLEIGKYLYSLII